MFQCQVGSKVSLRVGGDFYYDPSKEEQKRTLVLIAGGVGINPIFSIVQHLSNLGSRVNTVVLYSAASMKELIFKVRFPQLYLTLLLFFFVNIILFCPSPLAIAFGILVLIPVLPGPTRATSELSRLHLLSVFHHQGDHRGGGTSGSDTPDMYVITLINSTTSGVV